MRGIGSKIPYNINLDVLKARVIRSARVANLLYDVFALFKDVPLFVVSTWPDVLHKFYPRGYLWAEQLLESNKYARFGKTALSLYFGAMIFNTVARLTYLTITKKVPPSLPEYPVVAKRLVVQGAKRVFNALTDRCKPDFK